MAVDRALVRRRLLDLVRFVDELRTHREELARALSRLWAIEHGLQLAIQILVDAGSHLLASTGRSGGESCQEVIECPGREGHPPGRLRGPDPPMAGPARLLSLIRDPLDDFLELARHVRTHLGT